jgi:hypothetical protein
MRHRSLSPLAFALAAVTALAAPALAQGKQGKTDYRADVAFAVDEIGKQCKDLLAHKGIDWKKVTKPLVAESKKTKNDAEHLLLLWRLLARLEDGHAAVKPLPAGEGVKLELPERSGAPGLFLCRVGARVFVKNAWGPAQEVGIAPGMEVVALDGQPVAAWLAARTAALRDLLSFSTDHQADYYTRHQGLADAPGTRLTVECKELDGKGGKKRTITMVKGSQGVFGPAFPPAGLERKGDVSYGRTAAGFGYLHVRRCKEDLPERVDQALAAIGEVPGMILDFRGNGGGGFDHQALFGRFLPKGTKWQVGSGYASAGPNPYGGPLVVLLDAACRSAGETGAGQFLEDGRALGLGESPTAGMSSSKATIELPSGLFALYVSVRSNKARFAGGQGIEGFGVAPHRTVAFDPQDLAAGQDTLILCAEAALREPGQGEDWKKVRYDPAAHGWTPPGK